MSIISAFKLISLRLAEGADKEYDLAAVTAGGYPLKGEYNADMKLIDRVKEKYRK